MHLSEQVGTYYVMQHKATLLSFVPTDILWEAIRDYRMDQEAKQKNETNGGKGEKRSNGVVASAGDDWDAKRQRTGTDAEDAEAVGGEVRVIGDEKAVDGEDAEAVADAVAVDGEGREKDEPPVMVGDAKDADDNDRKRHDTLSLVLCLAGGSMRSSRPKLSQSLVRMRRRRMPSMPRSRSPAQRKRQLHPIGRRWQRMLIMNQSSVCSCATWNEVCLHIPGVAHFFQSDGGSRNEMLGNR